MRLRLGFVANSSSSDYLYIPACDNCGMAEDYCDCGPDLHIPGKLYYKTQLREKQIQQELPFVEEEVRREIAPWIRFK